jgi:HPt (histidine-containing phosphotransfer) domain-containing protein
VPEKETQLSPAIFEQLRFAMTADPAGFIDLYREYLADARESLTLLKASIENRDATAVQTRAHYLRSSSLVLGATRVAAEVANLEQTAMSGTLNDASKILGEAEHRLNQVTAELVEVLGADVVPADKTAA